GIATTKRRPAPPGRWAGRSGVSRDAISGPGPRPFAMARIMHHQPSARETFDGPGRHAGDEPAGGSHQVIKGGLMNLLFRAVAAAALILPMVAGPVAAQNYRGAWGVYGGGIWFSDFNNNGDFDDLPAGFGTADLSLSSGWIAGTQLEYWFGNGRFGIRANGSYTERPFDVDGNGFDEEFGDVNTW